MTLAHGVGLLLLGLILSIGVFYCITLAERTETHRDTDTVLDDFNRRQDG